MTTTTAATLPALNPLTDTDLRLMLLIRHFENALLDLFGQGALNGTTHTCLGQEYIPVALRALLSDEDFVFSNHRGHGHYLARHEDPSGLLAEIMGREGAVCNGVGGSQHILRGRYLSTGVQGQSMPVAVGVAMSLRAREPGRLVCVHTGDGTWGEGAVYEALNMAQLWRLPLLVVVEHNGIAQTTPTSAQMAGSIAGRAAAFGVRHQRINTVDVPSIRGTVAPLVDEVRRGGGPLVLEFATHRLGPHSKGDDTRGPEEVEAARLADWYRRYAADRPEHFAAHDNDVLTRVAAVVQDVRGRAPAVWEQA